MAYGLFGKAPQKRDFLSLNMPNAVLHPFEAWLQSAVAASRSELGRDWDSHYLVAPIWRFWLGRDVLGTACMGAVMSSLDQVGRYFPLAIIYYANSGEELVSPLVNAQSPWFEAIEQRLLAVLSRTYEVDIATLLHGLAPPDATLRSRPQPRPAAAAPLAVLGRPGPNAHVEPPAGTVIRVTPAELSSPPAAASPLPAVDSEDKGAAPEIEPDLPAPADRSHEPAPPASLWDTEPEHENAASSDDGDHGSPSKLFQNGNAPHSSGEEFPWDDRSLSTEKSARAHETASLWGEAGGPFEQMELSRELPAEPTADVAEMPPEDHPTEEPALQQTAEAETPRVLAVTFKGGVSVLIEGEIDDPASQPVLLDHDHLNAAAGRSYWWCRLPAMGASRAYFKHGLPDPFFYSRMLLWEPRGGTDDRG